MKKTFYTELAYVLGILFLAFGTVLSEIASFGMSMVVAPAYVIHLAVSEYLPFFTFGMAEYSLQAVLIIGLMIVLRRFRISYLFSFVTAVIYGNVLDGFIYLCSPLATDNMVLRILYYTVGMILCCIGVAMHFKTYISPEAYELTVKEISSAKGIKTHKFKTAYDITSCLVAFILSIVFLGFGDFRGIGIGTLVSALTNGTVIGITSKLMEDRFEFKDGLKLRKIFEK